MRFSVVLPTYNRAHLLERSVRSVLNQSFSDFELIIVDDNSTDDTEDYINSIDDSRIIYIRHNKNKGPAAARNSGILNSKANFIAFQDSDDEWHKDKLQVFYDKFVNVIGLEYGLAYSRRSFIALGSKKLYYPPSWLPKKDGNVFEELLLRNFIDTPAAVVKRECFNKVGFFDEELSCLEDYDLFLRISKYYKVLYLDETLLISHATSGGVNSADFSVHASIHLKIFQKHIHDYDINSSIICSKYISIGDYYSLGNDYNSARIFFRKAIDINKTNIATLVLYFASLGEQYFIKGIYKFCRKLILKIKLIFSLRPELF